MNLYHITTVYPGPDLRGSLGLRVKTWGRVLLINWLLLTLQRKIKHKITLFFCKQLILFCVPRHL